MTAMYRFLAVPLICCLVLVAACGDDDPGTTDGTDTAQDSSDLGNRDTGVVADSGDDDTSVGDQGGDVEDDTQTDGDVETDVPLVEICDDGDDNDGDGLVDCDDDDCTEECEICSDLMDNDEDGRIDCADPDCSDSELCPERCQNDIDDDADGDADCDDSECSESTRCTEPPVAIEDYEFSGVSYFYHLQVPPPGVDCCFDYDDDPALDNQLLLALNAIPDYDAQSNFNFAINNGSVALLMEWADFPEELSTDGTVDFNLHRGIPVTPEPPLSMEPPYLPEDNLWNDNAGIFVIDPGSFDSRGPRIRFEANDLTSGVVTGGPHFLNLTVPIPELGVDLDLTVFEARIEMILEEVVDNETTYLRTVPQTVEEVTVGGGRLGGVIRADDFFAFLNESAGNCACAAPIGVDPASSVMLAYGENPDSIFGYEAGCNWDPLNPPDIGDGPYNTCDDDESALPVCDFLVNICTLAGALPLLLDVDANKNGFEESLSVGLYFELAGANLDDPPYDIPE